MDAVSSTISKDWVGLILLPGISSVAGYYFIPFYKTSQAHIANRMPQRRQSVSQG
jgi:hypothetical protein